MIIEYFLIFINFILLGGALAYNSRKTDGMRSDYERRMTEYESKIDELEKSMCVVVTETLRLTGENIWLRNILSMNQIDIPPLPEHLRPHLDERGNITIMITDTGVKVGAGARVGQAAAGEHILQDAPKDKSK